MRNVVTILTLIVVCASTVGCEDGKSCDLRDVDRSDVLPFEDGTWASSPFPSADEPLPETRPLIQIFPESCILLRHGLGRAPVQINAYVGFDPADPSYVMPATGNAVEIRDVTSEHIEVRNGSGGSFYYRFVLR